MQVFNYANLSSQQLAAIVDELREQQNLYDVMQWALADETGAFLPGVVSDVVVQDEFSHDVVIPFHDNLVLVYDTTWLGGVTAVAVWDHQPDADELLQARLARGWRPTASMLKEGDKILGHAACLPMLKTPS